MSAESHTISRPLSGTAARWVIGGEWRAHPGRVIVAAAAIAVGVALGFAVHLINASALNEFARAVRTVNGDADLQVHSVDARGFDESLYPALAHVFGVAGASPVVELTAVAKGNGPPLTLIGVDVLRAGLVTPSLAARSTSLADPFDPTAVFLSPAALAALGTQPGATITLSAGGHDADFKIAGTLSATTEGQRIAVIDIAAAQWRFGALGRLQRIDLKLAEGVDERRVQAAITALLPGNARIVDQESEARRTDSLSRAYRVNLDMLALMALLSGTFLVYSAQSLSVARRRAQFALLRVLGVERRGLLLQVLLEGGIVGAIGSGLGLAIGLALAQTALAFFGGDLGGGYFRGIRPALVFAPEAAAIFFALGVLAAVLGSLLPAREVANTPPAIALKDVGDATDPRAWPAAWPALLLLIAGTAAAFFPAVGSIALFGYISIGLLLAGGVAAMPLIARLLLAPLQRIAIKGAAIDLALKRLWGAPAQAAIALCGIVASTSLMIAMAVMVWSFRGSVEQWLAQVLPDDVYIRLDDGAGLNAKTQAALAKAPGIAAIHFRKQTPLLLSPDRPPVMLVVQPVDRVRPTASLPLIDAPLLPPVGTIAVWLSEPAALLYDYQRGDSIALPIGTRAGKFFVAGIWRDYARQQGAIAMDERDYTQLTGDMLRSDGSIVLAKGASVPNAILAMRAALPESIRARAFFALPGQIRAISLGIFDRSFAVTYLLEAIAILVGLAGVGATFSAQTLARTKEFGMLRHIGVSRRQIAIMLVAEGAALGAVGVIAGIGLGLAIAQVLIHVVNPQSFHWTMDTRLPLALFVTVAAALIVAAAGTALLSGRRALSADAVHAVKEDW